MFMNKVYCNKCQGNLSLCAHPLTCEKICAHRFLSQVVAIDTNLQKLKNYKFPLWLNYICLCMASLSMKEF